MLSLRTSSANTGQRSPVFLLLLQLLIPLSILAGCGRDTRVPVATDVTEVTRNPFEFEEDEMVIGEGKRLFLNNCSICHGHQGQGDGPSRSTLIAEPANLTVDPVASYPDGRLFLVVRLGKMVDGRLTMPPVEKMTDEQIWKAIAYVRTLRSVPSLQNR